jgi:hypothetical protein
MIAPAANGGKTVWRVNTIAPPRSLARTLSDCAAAPVRQVVRHFHIIS